MSIVFNPTIPAQFNIDRKKAKQFVEGVVVRRRSWTKKDIERLLYLRAMHVSWKECESLLGRTKGSCAVFLHTTGSLPEVNALRNELINNIMAAEPNE